MTFSEINAEKNVSSCILLCFSIVVIQGVFGVNFEEHFRSKYTEIDDIITFFAPQLLIIKYIQKSLYNYLACIQQL